MQVYHSQQTGTFYSNGISGIGIINKKKDNMMNIIVH